MMLKIKNLEIHEAVVRLRFTEFKYLKYIHY